MKILALDFSNGFEDICRFPKKYGGVGRTISLLKTYIPNFYVAADEDSFKNCSLDEAKNNIILKPYQIDELRRGENLAKVIDNIRTYDLVFHTSTATWINTDIPTLVWSPGFKEAVHVKNENVLCHNIKGQQPVLTNPDTGLYEFVLGIEIPEFKENKKQDYIFQCSNHYSSIGTEHVINWCNKYGIRGYFAGPIDEGYKQILGLFDNHNTHYLGLIEEEEKIKYIKEANFVTLLYLHPINECPLTAKQTLSLGTPILTTGAGHMSQVIQHGYNGFIIKSEKDFVDAWSLKDYVPQINCYNSVKDRYSVEKMISSFLQVAEQVCKQK